MPISRDELVAAEVEVEYARREFRAALRRYMTAHSHLEELFAEVEAARHGD